MLIAINHMGANVRETTAHHTPKALTTFMEAVSLFNVTMGWMSSKERKKLCSRWSSAAAKRWIVDVPCETTMGRRCGRRKASVREWRAQKKVAIDNFVTCLMFSAFRQIKLMQITRSDQSKDAYLMGRERESERLSTTRRFLSFGWSLACQKVLRWNTLKSVRVRNELWVDGMLGTIIG